MRLILATAAFLALASASSALAATSLPTEATPASVQARPLRPLKAARTWPRVEWHGYLRFRPDWISNGHLSQAALSERSDVPVLTTSAIQPPLSSWPQNNGQSNGFSSQVGSSRDEDGVTMATMRLRLRPTVHLMKGLSATVTADLFDNYVFGSQGEFGGDRFDVPLSAFANTARSTPLSIKEAFLRWSSELLDVKVGRQGAHWGLGIFQHAGLGTAWDDGRPLLYYGEPLNPGAGSGYDLDAGDFLDRAQVELHLGSFDLRLFGDYQTVGLRWDEPGRIDSLQWDSSAGGAVIQTGLALGQWVSGPKEVAERMTRLGGLGGVAFDWGLMGLYRTQQLDAGGDSSATVLDGWFRLERRVTAAQRFILEAEAVYLRGEVGSQQTVSSWGAALKGAFQFDNMGVYLDTGVASGDDTRCFGVVGRNGCGLKDVNGDLNTEVTGYRFHRNFRVDSLLFRDVIGAVSNAWYVKPSFAINAFPFTAPGDLLGADLSVLVAGAMEAEGTPGNGTTLGTEFALRAYVGYAGLFRTTVSFSYLIAGDAFDLIGPADEIRGKWLGSTESVTAENAWRLMIRSAMTF